MAFSENLRTSRKEKGLSQEQLAELLNVSRQAVSKWELDEGYPETEKLIQIAETLGVSLDYLLLDRPTVNSGIDDAPKSNSDSLADKKITIRSYDGSRLSAYNEFTIIPIGFSGYKRPRCVLGAGVKESGVWNNGLTILGWYATIENAQRELDEIHHAIQNGETSYQLKYFAKVTGRFNPKIIDSDTTV